MLLRLSLCAVTLLGCGSSVTLSGDDPAGTGAGGSASSSSGGSGPEVCTPACADSHEVCLSGVCEEVSTLFVDVHPGTTFFLSARGYGPTDDAAATTRPSLASVNGCVAQGPPEASPDAEPGEWNVPLDLDLGTATVAVNGSAALPLSGPVDGGWSTFVDIPPGATVTLVVTGGSDVAGFTHTFVVPGRPALAPPNDFIPGEDFVLGLAPELPRAQDYSVVLYDTSNLEAALASCTYDGGALPPEPTIDQAVTAFLPPGVNTAVVFAQNRQDLEPTSDPRIRLRASATHDLRLDL